MPNATTMKVTPVKADAKFPTRNTLLYGASGVGKTHLIGTAQQDERLAPVINLDFDGGGATLDGSGVKTESMRDWQDFNQQYAMLASDANKYKTVSIDSVTFTQIFSMFDIADTRPEKSEKQKSEKESERDKNKFQLDEYGIALNMMQRLILAFRNLPMNVIMTALADTKDIPREGMTRIPKTYGQLAELLPGWFDGVFYYYIDKNKQDMSQSERVLILQNYPNVTAKIRTKWGVVAPDEIVNPTFTDIYNAYGL